MNRFLKNCFLALRPKQWSKNLLLLVAPFAAGVDITSNTRTIFLGVFTFSLVSSIGYIFNDLGDIEIDRFHPKKSFRPFASGILTRAVGDFLILILFSILCVLLRQLPQIFGLILILYLVNSILYTRILKTIPVVEMFSVSFGFVLRLISGALVLDLIISEWFMIVGGFGAFFVVSAKRMAEFKQQTQRGVRKVVRAYSLDFLHTCSSVSISVTVTSYCLWAFAQSQSPFWHQISVIPFVMSLFRYRWISETSAVETPEDVILGDKTLLILSTCLILFLSIAIF